MSAGILAAHRQGIVTSTTALVNRAIPLAQIGAALDAGIGIGLHMNLTLGAPITRAPSLVDGSGRFVRDARQAAARAERQRSRPRSRLSSSGSRRSSDVHRRISIRTTTWACFHPCARSSSPGRFGAGPGSEPERRGSAGGALGRLATPDHFFGESGPGAYWTPARTLGTSDAFRGACPSS